MMTHDDMIVLDMLTDEDIVQYLHRTRGWRIDLITTLNGDACMHVLRSGWTTLPVTRRVA
jgi:hypothetical protein